MRKSLSLIFILLISLSLIVENVKAEQMFYTGFEGFNVYGSRWNNVHYGERSRRSI